MSHDSVLLRQGCFDDGSVCRLKHERCNNWTAKVAKHPWPVSQLGNLNKKTASTITVKSETFPHAEVSGKCLLPFSYRWLYLLAQWKESAIIYEVFNHHRLLKACSYINKDQLLCSKMIRVCVCVFVLSRLAAPAIVWCREIFPQWRVSNTTSRKSERVGRQKLWKLHPIINC